MITEGKTCSLILFSGRQSFLYFSQVNFWARQQHRWVAPLALLAQSESPNAAVVRLDATHLPEVGGVPNDGYDCLLPIQEPPDKPLNAGNDQWGVDVLLDAPLVDFWGSIQ